MTEKLTFDKVKVGFGMPPWLMPYFMQEHLSDRTVYMYEGMVIIHVTCFLQGRVYVQVWSDNECVEHEAVFPLEEWYNERIAPHLYLDASAQEYIERGYEVDYATMKLRYLKRDGVGVILSHDGASTRRLTPGVPMQYCPEYK